MTILAIFVIVTYLCAIRAHVRIDKLEAELKCRSLQKPNNA
jgi:hypothetical protein